MFFLKKVAPTYLMLLCMQASNTGLQASNLNGVLTSDNVKVAHIAIDKNNVGFTLPRFSDVYAFSPPAKMKEINDICKDVDAFIQNSENLANKRIIVTIPDLHGAHFRYDLLVRFFDRLRRTYPNNKIDVVFPGDAAPRFDPPECPKDQQLGLFCTNLLKPLSLIDNLQIVYAPGNHDFQNSWRFLNFLRFLEQENIPFITHFKEAFRKDWTGVKNKSTTTYEIDSTESWEDYEVFDGEYITGGEGIEETVPFDPKCVKELLVSGNTLFFPYCLAWACYGGGAGGSGTSEIFAEDYLGSLITLSCDDSRVLEKIGDHPYHPVVEHVARTFKQGIEQLIRENPGDTPLNVFIVSHATDGQTEQLFNKVFEAYPDSRICERNFGKDAARIKVCVAGGHHHGLFTKTIKLKTDGVNEVDVPYCASPMFGAGVHVWLLDDDGASDFERIERNSAYFEDVESKLIPKILTCTREDIAQVIAPNQPIDPDAEKKLDLSNVNREDPAQAIPDQAIDPAQATDPDAKKKLDLSNVNKAIDSCEKSLYGAITCVQLFIDGLSRCGKQYEQVLTHLRTLRLELYNVPNLQNVDFPLYTRLILPNAFPREPLSARGTFVNVNKRVQCKAIGLYGSAFTSVDRAKSEGFLEAIRSDDVKAQLTNVFNLVANNTNEQGLCRSATYDNLERLTIGAAKVRKRLRNLH
ncbi:MAG: metallophosphoesterase, partial [Holosporales bacterium]|nr:metallophosphoesterase [Holosporales bacterium]